MAARHAMRLRAPSLARWIAIALCVALAGCERPPARERLIVLGLDGVDPDVVDMLVAEGRLPHLARMAREGAHGRLASTPPLLSPILWTTIATGRPPLDHGITHFVARNAKTGEELPVTSRMRRVKALWNLLSDAGREVAVVGWWATWPAEAVRGAVVSDHVSYHFLFEEGFEDRDDPVGLVHPPELLEALAPYVRRPADVRFEEAARFLDVPPEAFARPFAFDDDLGHFRWALAAAETNRRIGLALWRERRPDLLLVYVELVDSTSHLFGHLFRRQDLAGDLARQQADYGRAVEEAYRYADEIVGEYLAARDPDTTLVVLSDHGFELGALHADPSHARDLRRVSERFHRRDGILYLLGPRVAAGTTIEDAAILDVTPTLLAVAGLAPARDMPGRVLHEAVAVEPELLRVPRALASYEDAGVAPGAATPEGDARVDPLVLERLRALGYVESPSPQGERNLAALHFEAGRYEEAARLYERLVAESPEDGRLRASYAGALGALGRFEQSLAQSAEALAREPLNPEAYYNRGVVHEQQARPGEAAEEYRLALLCDPGYEPARGALARLGEPAPSTRRAPGDERAAPLLARAHQAAIRGDYDGALRALDEAERVAPDSARVFHYRANVAFLGGDRVAAAAALRRALALDPGNPLYRANLDRLGADAER